jgi:hypothetical protein
MKTENKKPEQPRSLTWIVCGCITLVFLLSVRAQSILLSPQFNSDHAIHVLMAADLQLPQDLYYWGQDRLGSIVPIMGHLLLKVFPMRPSEAVAIAQFFFLMLGYCCFAILLQTMRSRLILALIWFLPLPCFYEFLSIGQPYGPQFAFLGLAFVLLNRVYQSGYNMDVERQRSTSIPQQQKSQVDPSQLSNVSLLQTADAKHPWRRQVMLLLAIAALCISQWISDFAIVPIFTLVLFALWIIRPWSIRFRHGIHPLEVSENKQPSDWGQLKRDGLSIVSIYGLGFLGIQIAKRFAARTPKSYSSFVNWTELQVTLGKLWQNLAKTLTFQMDNPWLSFHAVLAIALISYLFWHAWQRRYFIVKHHSNQHRSNQHRSNPWIWITAGSAVIGLVLLIASRHVYQNKVNLRYFISIYLFAWIAILFYSEQLKGKLAKRVGIVMLVTAIASSAALPPRYFSIHRAPGKIEQLQPLRSLGQASFIGNYWAAYVLCSVNPNQLSCTPNDLANRPSQEVCRTNLDLPDSPRPKLQRLRSVRCPRCAQRVFASEQIYLVQSDRWLQTGFPAEINQFGRCLKKTGQPFQIAGYTMAPYRQD